MQRVAPDKDGGALYVHFGSSAKQAVITSAKQVDIYNYEDHRCLESWSSRTALSAAAVQHPRTGQLYAALDDGSQLSTWKRSESRLVDASTSPSQFFKVKSLHVCATVAGAVAVHANATVSIVGEDLSFPVRWVPGGGTSAARSTSRVVAASLVDDAEPGTATMHLFVDTTGETGACCHHLTVSASSIKLVRTLPFARPSPAGKSSILDAVHLRELQRVAIIWSCHTMQVFDISDTKPEATPVLRMTRCFREENSALVDADSRSMPLLAAVEPSCVLVAGLAPAADKRNRSSISDGLTLTLWDANWGTLQAEQRLPDPPEGFRVLAKAGVLHSQSKGLALLLAHGVCWRWELPSRPRGLLHSLGRLREQAQRFLVQEEDKHRPGHSVITKLQGAKNEAAFGRELRAYRELRAKADAQADAVAARALNRENEWICGIYSTETKGSKKKKEAFEKEKANKAAQWEKETAAKVASAIRTAASSPTGVLLDQGVLIAAVERCLRDGFWKELDGLLHSGQVSACTIPSLLSTLMEKKKMELLQSALIHVHDIPEANIAELLKYILSTEDGAAAGASAKAPAKKASGTGGSDESSESSSSSDDGDDDDDDDSVDDDEDSSSEDDDDEDEEEQGDEEGSTQLSPQLHQMLCLIVSRPRHDAALQRALRGLRTDHVTTLLQLLLTLLEHSETDASQGRQGGTAKPVKSSSLPPSKVGGGSGGGSVTDPILQSRFAPKMTQILDWAMLLLDVHFARLIVIPSCHALLRRWMAFVEAHERLAVAVTPLKGVLASIEKKQKEAKQKDREIEKKLKIAREKKAQQAAALAATVTKSQKKEKKNGNGDSGEVGGGSSRSKSPNKAKKRGSDNEENSSGGGGSSKQGKRKSDGGAAAGAARLGKLLGSVPTTQPAFSIEVVEFF